MRTAHYFQKDTPGEPNSRYSVIRNVFDYSLTYFTYFISDILICFVFCDTVLILFSICMALRHKISDHKLLDCRSVTVNKTSKPLCRIRRTNFQSFPVNLEICSSLFAFAFSNMIKNKLSRHDHRKTILDVMLAFYGFLTVLFSSFGNDVTEICIDLKNRHTVLYLHYIYDF